MCAFGPSSKLNSEPALRLAVAALEEGLSVLASPMVDVEHDGRNLNVNILLLAPEIVDKNNFCVVEHLTPLKFNLSGTCFTGPVQQSNLALITCPNAKQVVSVDALDRCFSSEVGLLCPKNVLRTITSLQWLCFAWNPELKLSFPRNHLSASNCQHLQPLVHLGGIFFLSTTSGTLTTNVGDYEITPLAVYNFPCNVSFTGMKTSLAMCPESLTVSLPLFSTETISYVPWNPDSDDISPLMLHRESLSIPPPTVINRTIISYFDELFQTYDGQLSAALDKADGMISKITYTSETSLAEYFAYAACALSVVNLIIFCIAFCGVYRIIRRLPTQKLCVPTNSTRIEVPLSQSHRMCKHCDKPVRQEQHSQKSAQSHKQKGRS